MKEYLESTINQVEVHYLDDKNNRISKAIDKAKKILASPNFIK
ncbi:hypothetical protein L21TH_2278 [Caldisalinibacter kiritimatiensis]|uniref:Uncharacterized protein n=1 Tax=Caldisalinibacter kiritimatiensis TaxID=1304284 RepID=R1CSL3_9FIRM|nr:hypothetical protein L21TH_2278 [Caldisalinibacter kiritimatiensis]